MQEDIETTTPPVETLETSYNFVHLDELQFETITKISQQADLLVNRIEVMLLIDVFLTFIILFLVMRSKR